MNTEKFTEKYFEYIKKEKILNGIDSVLVGFSGGADSVTLLRMLLLSGVKVYAAHIHHMIRGEEADRDLNFCIKTCNDLNVPIFCEKVDVPALSESLKKGTEETARLVRYEFFDRICKEHNIDAVATGHNMTDNAETVLFHIARGTGFDGLCGILPVKGNLIRPLLCFTKEEIIGFCNDNGYAFVTDSTNFDTDYSRNLIRHKIIPLMEQVNEGFQRNCSNMCQIVIDGKNIIDDRISGYGFQSGREVLSGLDDGLLFSVVKNECSKLGLHAEKKHIEEISGFIKSPKLQCEITVPGGTVVIDRNSIYSKQPIIDYEVELKYGLNELPNGYAVILSRYDSGTENYDENVYNLYTQISLNCDIINNPVWVRNRRNGDTYFVNNQTKKVKQLFQEKHLPLNERNSMPLIISKGRIIWIPGFAPVKDCNSDTRNDCLLKIMILRKRGYTF